jgi:hypothetical protein
MMAARASVPGAPTTAEPSRAPEPARPSTSASPALTFADPAASRTLARCPGCGGRCGGTCGGSAAKLDEDLMAEGQRALRRAVVARRALSPRS